MTWKEIVADLTALKNTVASLAGIVKAEDATVFKGKLDALESKVANEIASRDTEISTLKAGATTDATKITDLTTQLGAATAKVTTLEAAAKSAGQQATEVLAAAGVPAGAAPAAALDATANEPKRLRSKYNELRATDPRAAGEFYMKNADKMFS